MATASTTVLTALVALVLGNLLMIDALINPCTDADIGLINTGEIGLIRKDLKDMTLQKYVKKFRLLIPTNSTCHNPVGVWMRVCDYPSETGGESPVVTFESLDVAVVHVKRNDDPQHDDVAMISVFCLPLPPKTG